MQLITMITLAYYAIYDPILETYQIVTFSILRNTDFKGTVCRYQSHTITHHFIACKIIIKGT